ncbi:MAG: hypothetical protein R3A47_01380 [Polyangiales bacterium]
MSCAMLSATFNFALTEYAGHGAELTRMRFGRKNNVDIVRRRRHTWQVSHGIVSAKRAQRGRAPVLRGTGGDFRKMIRGSDDLKTACETITTNTAEPIDVGWVRLFPDSGAPIERYFLNITSFGMGGLVDRFVGESRRRFGGPAAYFGATLRAQLQYKPAKVQLAIDGREVGVFDVSAICVCNGQWAGGGMHFAPNAKLNDGVFDVVVIESTSILRGLPLMTQLYRGQHLGSPLVHSFRGSDVEAVTLKRTAWMDVDGEPAGIAPADYRLLPNALRIIGLKPSSA